MKKVWLQIVVLTIALAIMCTSAHAQESSDSWKFRLSPLYLWVINLNGDQTIASQTVPIDIKLGDVINNVEAVFTANFEAVHNNQWGLLVDFTYVNIDGSQTTGTVTQEVDFKTVLAEIDGFYRAIGGEHNLDLLLGLRYMSMDTDINISGAPPPIPPSLGGKKDWVDPIIGARWVWKFADRWALLVRGDIGGFGVGSDFTWQAAGLVDWQPFKYVSFTAGYRALYQDYEEGSGRDLFKYDATMHGPVIGFSIKW
jgi:hypothetical protein